MNYTVTCWYCGEMHTLVAARIWSGRLECQSCGEFGLNIPETELTPAQPVFAVEDPVEVIRFDQN